MVKSHRTPSQRINREECCPVLPFPFDMIGEEEPLLDWDLCAKPPRKINLRPIGCLTR